MNQKPTVKDSSHTGEEFYSATLVYEGDLLNVVRRQTEVGQIIPDTIVLVWARRVGEEWRRMVAGPSGSRAVGHQRLPLDAEGRGAQGTRRSREVFSREGGEIRSWASHLPGLRLVIADIEGEALPR